MRIENGPSCSRETSRASTECDYPQVTRSVPQFNCAVLVLAQRASSGSFIQRVLGYASCCDRESISESCCDYCAQRPPNHSANSIQFLDSRRFHGMPRTPKKKNGGAPSYATYNSHRSALFNLFRDYSEVMSADLQTKLANHFRGLKRTVAAEMAADVVACKEGKDSLPFDLCIRLGLLMLTSPSRDMIFGRTFLILSWNLMARASNTLSICHEHMQFCGDALCVYFAQMKTDQFADRPNDLRHVYANPLKPEVCPLLALGIMWLCYGFKCDSSRLFPGSRQYERFRHLLGRLLVEHQAELLIRGIAKEELGSHSIRKGSAIFCSFGSTACPPEAAIDLRAGWAQAGVKGRYVKHQKAGDMYVGRTATDLPINDAQFAILPPHFTQPESSQVRSAPILYFPRLPTQLSGVAEHALASVVFHHDFLLRVLPANHPLLGTVLFTTAGLLHELSSRVCCEIPSTTSRMTATGLPPHIAILQNFATLRDEVQELRQAQTSSCETIIKGVLRALDTHELSSSTVTASQLRQEIDENNERLVRMLTEHVGPRQVDTGHHGLEGVTYDTAETL